MSAIANIAVPDAAATPVTKTFVPLKVEGDTARWVEKSNAQPVGWYSLSATLRPPTGKQAGLPYRVTVDLAIPVTATYTSVSGAPVTVVDRVWRAKVELIESSTSTLQERKDGNKLLLGILGSAQFLAMLNDLENAY